MGLGDGVALLAGVHDEQGAGQLLHFLHAAQVLLQLGDLAQVLHDFLLGQHVEGAVLLHGLQLVQPVHAGAHGLEVGEHTAQPTGVDIEHVDAGSLLADGLLCLLLGAHEQQGLAALRQLTDEAVCLLQLADGLLQVHDIDAVALRVDIGSHLGVPATGLVTEVDARLQQGLHGYDARICHSCVFLQFQFSWSSGGFIPPANPAVLGPGHRQKVDAPCGMLKYSITIQCAMQVFFPKSRVKFPVLSEFVRVPQQPPICCCAAPVCLL